MTLEKLLNLFVPQLLICKMGLIIKLTSWDLCCRNKIVCQSCLTLCNSMDCSSPGSSAHGILQARILEWVAVPFSRGSSRLRDQIRVSCITSRFFTIWATREGYSIPRNRNSQVMQWWRTRLPMQEMQEMQVQSLCWGDPLEEEMAIHSSILAWKTLWTEEPGGL